MGPMRSRGLGAAARRNIYGHVIGCGLHARINWPSLGRRVPGFRKVRARPADRRPGSYVRNPKYCCHERLCVAWLDGRVEVQLKGIHGLRR